MDYTRLGEQLIPLARKVGREILSYYADVAKLKVETKANQTPLTEADLAAHRMLVAGLKSLYPDISILSEEDSPPVALDERQHWPTLWLIDPLDGTREFIEGSDNFCINIALVEHGAARFGLIYIPVSDTAYFGVVGEGAWRQSGTARRAITCRPIHSGESVTLIASRKRSKQALLNLEQRLATRFDQVERIGVGSAIKFCRMAEGAGDIYACFGPTSEWDTAAGQALIESAGGRMFSLAQQPFRYNQRDTLLNGGFFVLGDASYDWLALLPLEN